MTRSTLQLIILALVFLSTQSLERKRQNEEVEMQCTVSATGEKVCKSNTNNKDNFNNREESNGSQSMFNHDDDDEKEEDMDLFNEDEDDDKYDEMAEDTHVHTVNVGNVGNVATVGNDDCKDTHDLCSFWASIDECAKNPNYMLTNCPKSCNSCPKKVVEGLTGEQDVETESILNQVKQYGEPQEEGGVGQARAKTMFSIRKTVDYMKNFIYAEHPTHQLSDATIAACRNTHTSCSYWASMGECKNNPSFMVTKCAPACLSCHKIDYDMR